MEETVNVTAESPLVDVTSKEIGGNITSETLVQLPSVNGNFIGFIGLLPGIVPSISTESFGSDSISVNGQDPAQQQLHGRRRQQQRRRHRPARRACRRGRRSRRSRSSRSSPASSTPSSAAPSGAVVNAVIKTGTNTVRGSAFGFFQDSSLTTKDFFAKQRDLAKAGHQLPALGRHHRRTDRQGQDALLRQPRALRDRSRRTRIVIPARPDLNDQQTTQDRVWNTIIRGDHQLSPSHTYNVRWLREQSPQANQIVPTGDQAARPAAARRARGDRRRPVARGQPQLGAVEHEGQHAARHLDARERHVRQRLLQRPTAATCRQCQPTLPFQNFIDQQDNTGQSRINDGIAVRRHAGLVPARQARRPRHQGRRAVRLLGRAEREPGQPERHVHVRPEQRRLQSGDPATYPDRFTIRVGGPSQFYQKAHYVSAFAQDKWRLTPRLTLSLGLRYDLEIIPLAETDNPLVDELPGRQEQLPAAGRRHLRSRRRQERRPRRLRALLRQDALRADWRPLHGHAVHHLVRRQLPDRGRRCRPAHRAAADRPVPGQRSGDQPRAARPAVPGGQLLRNTGASWDNADRAVPYTDQVTLGYERQLGANLAVSADYVHAFSRDLLMSLDLNPGLRATTAATSHAGPAAASAALDDGLRGAAGDLSGLRQLHDRR